jgi:hypothetical protein
MAAMPELPNGVELEATPILLGVDHQHSAGADGQVDAPIACRRWLGAGPVVLAQG